MTPDQIDLVKTTFASLDRAAVEPERFYEQLFIDHPEMRDRFPDPLGRLPAKFWAGLRELVARLDDVAGLTAEAAAAGSRHRSMAVNTVEFANFGEALATVASTTLGTAFTDDHREALAQTWILVTEVLLQRPQTMSGGVL